MKKFISFVMAAAMVVSMVPATAFAAEAKYEISTTARIIDAKKLTLDNAKAGGEGKLYAGTTAAASAAIAPEIQIRVSSVSYTNTTTGTDPNMAVTLQLDNANLKFWADVAAGTYYADDTKIPYISIRDRDDVVFDAANADPSGDLGFRLANTGALPYVSKVEVLGKDEVKITFTGFFAVGDMINIDLASAITTSVAGRTATVSVSGDVTKVDDLVFATVVREGLTASIRDTVDVAEEEVAELNSRGLVLDKAMENYKVGDVITLRLSRGFEFDSARSAVEVNGSSAAADYKIDFTGDNELTITIESGATLSKKLTITGLVVEATTAKVGATATVTARLSGVDGNFSDTVDVAVVVDYKVVATVDADEDVPVIYSGVNVANKGITDDSDHWSLEVTAKETFPGAWGMRQGFTISLPEGVYVTDVKIVDTENFWIIEGGKTEPVTPDHWDKAFEKAYQDGGHVTFDFPRRTFNDVDSVLYTDPAEVVFQLQLVADPTFEGDVELTLEGALIGKNVVTIAKFVKPYKVSAEQNDVIIDYRFTAVETPIVIVETADGLWAKNDATFRFEIETNSIHFEKNSATYTVDDSGMELKDKTTATGITLSFTVKTESDDAATVTIEDLELFMQRSIPAGPYALEIGSSLEDAYLAQPLFAAKGTKLTVDDVADYSHVVKESFLNVITAGRDVDDASFTTKVVVPVGEYYLISGERQVALDVPAYITASGYTMLPVRAVAYALGISVDSVLWNASARQVTILYGQRIITMTVGQKVIHVNGSAIASSAEVEITNDRAFLPMRDLATALGVTDITWDAASRTATLNGNR